MAERKHFTFVGDGPSYATALFSAAKVLEAVGRDAWGQDTGSGPTCSTSAAWNRTPPRS